MKAGRPPARGKLEIASGAVAFGAIIAAGVVLAVQRHSPVEPGLVAAADSLDFGTVWEQPKLTHLVEVKNPTDRPIHVASIASGCGCTTVEPQTFTVPAGGTQKIIATLDLTGRGGEASDFSVDLRPRLSIEPDGRQTAWMLTGRLRTNPIVVSPPVVDYGDAVIVGEAPPTFDIDVSLIEGAPFASLRAVASGDAAGDLALYPLGPHRWSLAISPRHDLPSGPFEFTVRLEARQGRQLPESSNEAQTPFRELRVCGTVRDELTAWPRQISFGALEVGSFQQEYVVLASHRGRPFEVERIESPPGMVVEPSPQEFQDGSRTDIIRQRATKRDLQESDVTFHLRRETSPAEPFVVKLRVSYYGIEPATPPVSDDKNPPSSTSDEDRL